MLTFRLLIKHVLINSQISVSKETVSRMGCRGYSDKPEGGDSCQRAHADIPPVKDPVCDKKIKKVSLLHKIKLKILEGGSNFGTPFRRLKCPPEEVPCEPRVCSPCPCLPTAPKPKELPDSYRPGKQVSILGADTSVGQYIAFLLKQNPSIRRIRLYEATDTTCNPTQRDMSNVVCDLKNIDTNCTIQGYSCLCRHNLEACLQNTDVVLILESALLKPNMSLEERFYTQAPLMKHYADVISAQCPSAFIIVCASPIDCMVPLIAETLKEVNAFDSRKLLGSLAVPEMRASTLAAQALSLQPKYVRVPCIGGTEGDSLVPLFSKSVQYFDFSECDARNLTETVRKSVREDEDPVTVRAADLSEAHAIAGLVIKIVNSLLCQEVAEVTGFVECLPSQVLSPLRYMANKVEIRRCGICRNVGLPKMQDYEADWFCWAMQDMHYKLALTMDYQCKCLSSTRRFDKCMSQFFQPRSYKRFRDTAYTLM